MRLLSWRCEAWSGNKKYVKMLDAFHHTATCRTMGVSMSREKDERIRNSTTNKWGFDAEKMADVWRRLQLLFLVRIARLDKNACPPQIFIATTLGNICSGRTFRTIRESFVENLNFVINNLDRTHHWIV